MPLAKVACKIRKIHPRLTIYKNWTAAVINFLFVQAQARPHPPPPPNCLAVPSQTLTEVEE